MSVTIKKMYEEHAYIGRVVAVLEQQTEYMAEGDAPDYPLMQDIVDYLIDFPDLVHHKKEDVVFAKLLDRNDQLDAIIKEIEEEHKLISSKGHEICTLLEDIVLETVVSRDQVVRQLMQYIDLYKNHLSKEEKELFSLAAHTLSAKDWKGLNSALPDDEDPIFGKQVKKRYAALYESIIEASGVV